MRTLGGFDSKDMKMISLIKYLRSALLIVLLVLSVTLSVEAQQPERCEVTPNTNAPEYRIGQTMRGGPRLNNLVILISVDPKYFNRESMLAIARRLNEEFCNEQRFNVMLFDNHDAATDEVFDLKSKNFDRNLVSWRGNYKYDREHGLAKINFATERGHRQRDEVVIDVNK
jgi:hypothetical protein